MALVVVGAAASHVVTQRALPWGTGEDDLTYALRSESGSLRYQVHLPPEHELGRALPVVMALHGCAMTGFGANSMRSTTQLNELADQQGFIVVYPTQQFLADRFNCWRSADPRDQHRYTGEPAMLAGIAREVITRYGGDPARVHVAGASSGAGAAVVLAATYPDVFASVTSVAGGEYGLNQVDVDDPQSTPPTYTARQAWAQMGSRARRVPLLVIQGDRDEVVTPLVAERLVEQFTAIADLLDDQLANDSIASTTVSTQVSAAAPRRAYRADVVRSGDGATIAESYLVEGMEHAWPGPNGDGIFTDPAGPDASALLWDFAQRHPMR